MKVALVTDWLVGIGGAERVVVELHKLFPEAPIYTSQHDPSKLDLLAGADVRTPWLQKLPIATRKFMPVLRAWVFSRLDLSDYDLVISISGAEAKFVKTKPPQVHVSYCHSPTHYYWRRYSEYLKSPGFGLFNPLARLGLRLLVGPMRRWDKQAAQRPDYFIANSHHTKNEIKKYYGREATIIHPPVDIERFGSKDNQKRRGFVTAGRQTPYKRIDLAVVACTKLDLPLNVIGDGPEHRKLKRLAGPSVKFLGSLADEAVPKYFQAAEAFILPTNVEDFGVTGVEAMAAGTPVIAYRGGGPLDYVEPGQTGLFFAELTPGSLIKTLQEFQTSQGFDHAAITKYAERFSAARFQTKFKDFLARVTKA